MKAAVWHGVKDLRVEEVELRELRNDEVKVKVAWAGICGSDLHEYEEGPVFVPVGEKADITGEVAPLTMGHEFAGIIEEVGPEVKDFKVGDRVVINPTRTYGKKHESVDRFDGFNFIGLHGNGGFATYANIPSTNIHLLADNLTLQDGALVEPTAVAVQATIDSGVSLGDAVAVFGAGPIGQLQVIAAKAAGASTVIALDLSDDRLEKAKELGATHVVNSGKVDPVEAVREIVPEGVDVSFEVAGVAPTFKQAIDATKPGGVMMIVSIFARPIEWSPLQLINTGVNIKSSIVYTPTTFQKTINAMSSGQLKPQAIITKQIALDEIVEEGFETLTTDKSQSKILVEISGEK